MKKELIQYVEDTYVTAKEFPTFKAGDTVTVSYRIVEGSKERIQQFQGVVLQIGGHGVTKNFWWYWRRAYIPIRFSFYC